MNATAAASAATNALEITTPSDRELVMKRVFDAPRRLVFDALTKPELLRRWYGPRGWTLIACEIDLRVGGRWHFVTRRDDGREMGQHGVYREIARPERLANTEEWDDWPGADLLATTVLTEEGGRTTLLNTLLFSSQEVRDILIKSGMTRGAGETYDRLAELLAVSLAEASV